MISKYIIAGLGAALLAASVATVVQTRRLNTAKLDIAVLESQVGDKDSLIDMQSKAVTDLQKAEQDRILEIAKRGARIAELLNTLDAERAKRRAATEADYALPGCKQLMETDLAGVCPAHALSVRDAAPNR